MSPSLLREKGGFTDPAFDNEGAWADNEALGDRAAAQILHEDVVTGEIYHTPAVHVDGVAGDIVGEVILRAGNSNIAVQGFIPAHYRKIHSTNVI